MSALLGIVLAFAVSAVASCEQTPWLDDKHVVFGEVIDGARTVKDIELLGSSSGKTSKTVRCFILFYFSLLSCG